MTPTDQPGARQVQVYDRLGHLDGTIDNLDISMKELLARLEPVLSVAPPSAASGKPSVPELGLVGLAERIHTQGERVTQITLVIRGLLERLEI